MCLPNNEEPDKLRISNSSGPAGGAGGRAEPPGHLEGQVRPEASSSRSVLTCSPAPGRSPARTLERQP